MVRGRLSAVVLGCLLVLSLLAGSFSIPAAADGEYAITIEESVDTPTRDVELEGATYEISAIAKANEGDSMGVTVQAPDPDQFYRVYLYNSDRQIIKGGFGEGDKTVEFDLDNLTAGTYVFVVQQQGANQVIHPLVIKGYETSIDAPASAVRGEDVRVNVTIDQLEENITHDRIEVVLAGQSQQIRTAATLTDGTYSTTIDTQDLSPGSYDVYANVRGEQVVFDEQVIFGVSDAQALRIDSSETVSSSSSPSAQDSTNEVNSATSVSGSRTDSSNSESVLTPASQSQPTTDTKLPGFGAITAIVMIVIVGVMLRSQ